MKRKYRNSLLILTVLTGLVILLVVSGIIGAEHYTARPEFCGACHIMKSYYNSWKRSSHGEKDIACLVCHDPQKEEQNAHLHFKGIRQLLTYFSFGEEEIRIPTRVSDSNCLTQKCHPDIKRKVKLTETVSLNHDKHMSIIFEKQRLHCSTCHHTANSDKHFEVTKDVCYLCHFINRKFNEGLAKCSLCHKIPPDSLERHKRHFKGNWWQEDGYDDNSITHQSLEEAKVPCQSCHYNIVKGNGEVNKLTCSVCHNNILKPASKTGETRREKTDHSTGQHVAGQYAACSDCHAPIQHKELEFLDPVAESCFVCHPDHHKFQKLLLLGEKRDDALNIPGLMYDAKTNCIACHREEKLIEGEKVLRGSAKTCAGCHTKRYEIMVEEWKNKTAEELTHARELEEKAKKAIIHAEGKVSGNKLEEAKALLRKGQKNISIVQYGGGVHNNRYSVTLLDAAMNDFEKIMDSFNE